MANITKPVILDETGIRIAAAIEALAGGGGDSKEIYAVHYSENDSSPASVNYPAGYDNSSFTNPAYMDFANDAFNWGDWETKKSGLITPRSCMVKYDGSVDYYLDEDDETKKESGAASDVADSSYAGNAMVEWAKEDKKIYWKLVPDSDGLGWTFVVANYRPDSSFFPWNHYNCEGNAADHWYGAKYFGSSDGTRLRSISGGTNYVNTATADEVSKAEANNLNANKKIWTIETYADWLFEYLMMVLLSKSTNTQAKYGAGRCKSTNNAAIGQGTMNGKGIMWGSNDETSGVKIFGRENNYGNLWRRLYGLINVSGTIKIKLTYGQQDGSGVDGYNLTGENYISHGSIGGTSGGYISAMNITNRGLTPKTISGTDSTYYCDGGWFNNSQTNIALVGGSWNASSVVGCACWDLHGAAANASAGRGAALSCKPLA